MGLGLAAVLSLGFGVAGCAPRVPDSAAGVGFGDYGRYMREQEQRRAAATPWAGSDEGSAIAAEALAAVRPEATPASPPEAGPRPMAGRSSLSRDEVLDMDTARATRDSERAAFEARRASFETVAPTALPERPQDAPNIVAYALRTTHAVGQQRHRRSRLTTQNHARNCDGFANDDLAQEEFLRRGGPERDPLNLDPDGDGFACRWSPEPFRAAARARAAD